MSTDGTVSYGFKLDDETTGLDKIQGKLAATSAALDKAGELLRTVGGAMGQMAPKADQLARSTEKAGGAAKKASHEFKGVGQSVSDLRGKVHGFLEFTGALLAFEAIKRLTDGVMNLGREAIHAAASAERMDLSFKLLIGEEGAKGVFGWISKIAPLTEFTSDQLKGWSAQLLNAGVPLAAIDKFLVAGLDVAAKSTDKMAGMGAAIAALSRAQLTGRVEGRSLRAMNVGVAQLRTLPGFAGLSPDSINKKLDESSFTIDKVFDLIAGQDKLLGDLGLKAGATMGAKVKNVAGLKEDFLQKLAESPAFERLKTKLDEMFEKLNPDSPDGRRIFGALERAFSDIVDVIGKIDFSKVAATISDDVIPLIKEMLALFRLVEPVMAGIGQTVRGIKLIAGAKGSAKGDFFEKGQKAAGISDERMDELGFFEKIGVGLRGKLFGGGRDAGSAIAEGMAAGLKDGGPKVTATAADLGTTSIEAISTSIDAHSPSRKAAHLGEMTVAGFTAGIDRRREDVGVSTEAAFSLPSGPSAAGRMGGTTINMPITVEMHGGSGGREAGEAMAGPIAAKVREALISIVGDLRQEQGA